MKGSMVCLTSAGLSIVGGNSDDEIISGLFLYSKVQFNNLRSVKRGMVEQIDLVPSLSLLLGHPIPYGSLGMILPNLFEATDETITRNCYYSSDLSDDDLCHYLLSHDTLSFSYLLNSIQVIFYILDYFESVQFNGSHISNIALNLSEVLLPNICPFGIAQIDVARHSIHSGEVYRLHSLLSRAVIMHGQMLQMCSHIGDSKTYLSFRGQVHEAYRHFLLETLTFARY